MTLYSGTPAPRAPPPRRPARAPCGEPARRRPRSRPRAAPRRGAADGAEQRARRAHGRRRPFRRRRGEGDGVHPPRGQQRPQRRQRAPARRRRSGRRWVPPPRPRRRAARHRARAGSRRPAAPSRAREAPATRPAPRRSPRPWASRAPRTRASSRAPVAIGQRAAWKTEPVDRPGLLHRVGAGEGHPGEPAEPEQRGVETLGVGQRDGRELQHLGPELAKPGRPECVVAPGATVTTTSGRPGASLPDRRTEADDVPLASFEDVHRRRPPRPLSTARASPRARAWATGPRRSPRMTRAIDRGDQRPQADLPVGDRGVAGDGHLAAALDAGREPALGLESGRISDASSFASRPQRGRRASSASAPCATAGSLLRRPGGL